MAVSANNIVCVLQLNYTLILKYKDRLLYVVSPQRGGNGAQIDWNDINGRHGRYHTTLRAPPDVVSGAEVENAKMHFTASGGASFCINFGTTSHHPLPEYHRRVESTSPAGVTSHVVPIYTPGLALLACREDRCINRKTMLGSFGTAGGVHVLGDHIRGKLYCMVLDALHMVCFFGIVYLYHYRPRECIISCALFWQCNLLNCRRVYT